MKTVGRKMAPSWDIHNFLPQMGNGIARKELLPGARKEEKKKWEKLRPF
jgi:hypothetical protein